MTSGRFWVRFRGGHDLRRCYAAVDSMCQQTDGLSQGILVARADGPSAVTTTFPWVGHVASHRYKYALTVVGAGGVADEQDSPRLWLAFDENGDLLGEVPNAVNTLVVESLSAGRFQLRWTYDEANEEVAPSSFEIFNDAGNPGTVDYDNPVAVIPYRLRQGYFDWTSGVFAHDLRVSWAVRAVSEEGVSSHVITVADDTARAALPSVPGGIRVTGADC